MFVKFKENGKNESVVVTALFFVLICLLLFFLRFLFSVVCLAADIEFVTSFKRTVFIKYWLFILFGNLVVQILLLLCRSLHLGTYL